jgi:thiamine monophosphate synthase
VTPAIDLYVFAERNVFDSDARWLDALAELAAMDVPGLALQVRTKTEPPGRALALAREARTVTQDARIPVLLNGSTAEALALGYRGVHWPESLIPAVREDPEAFTRTGSAYESETPSPPLPAGRGGRGVRTAPPRAPEDAAFLSAASVHSPEAAVRAEAAGADFVVVGTIFDAGSKPVPGEGLAKLRRIAEATSLPVLAIGGLRPDRVAACIEAGAAGIAVVTSVLRAPDIAAAVRDLREALDVAAGFNPQDRHTEAAGFNSNDRRSAGRHRSPRSAR